MPIPTRSGVQIEDVLREFWSTAPLNDENDRCDHCGAHRAREQRYTVRRWPPVLLLHLKRWEVVQIFPRYRATKNDTHVSLQTTLDVRDGNGPHSLRGVVVHSGGVGGRHYTAFVRAQDNFWYFCDDGPAVPRRVATDVVLQSCAYMLVYER